MSLANAPLNATLPAHDIERAKRWYEEKLGVTPVMDLGVAGQLYTTGGTPWLIYQTPSAGTGKHTLAGFVVDNIDQTISELRAKGVKFEDYALGDQGPTTENGIARDPTGGASAWFTDSEGNILAITQLPPGMSMPGQG
ncbi:MAG TPA: VOC family protein [Candidatus Limnocylindrales bacterium]|nr:VOC family protein [Candidatus Limnocylindrales bacterium]